MRATGGARGSTIRTRGVRAEGEEWPLRGIIDCHAGAAGCSAGLSEKRRETS